MRTKREKERTRRRDEKDRAEEGQGEYKMYTDKLSVLDVMDVDVVHSCVDVHIYVNLDAKLCLCTNRHSVYVRAYTYTCVCLCCLACCSVCETVIEVTVSL